MKNAFFLNFFAHSDVKCPWVYINFAPDIQPATM